MRERWSNPSVALHWLGALLIVGLAAAGFVMTDLPTGSRGRLLLSRAHTLGGATLMLLTVAHALLYAVTFANGMSGFVTGARSSWPGYLRGSLTKAPALESMVSREAHEVLVFALVGLVALHVGGVPRQQLRRGEVVRRMLPLR